jgi:pimeloyl-ACP methyl ester carboxylesterase
MPRLSVGAEQDALDYTIKTPAGCDDPDTVVVYVHGFASHQRGEKALYFGERFLAQWCAYLTFDLRGHGASGGMMEELTISRAIEDLDTVLVWARERFSRCIVIGSSLGGQVAAWAAARRPEAVAANLLIAPAFGFYENRVRDLGEEGLARLLAEGRATIRNEWVTVTVGRALVDDAARYPVDRLITSYRTPTLIVHGTDDASVPVAGSVDFVRRSAARPLELVVFGGGDHRLTDRKAALFDAMEGFVRRLGVCPSISM